MTRRLTVAERHAAADKDLLLSEITAQSKWSQFLVEQAVYAVGLTNDTFTCNTLRNLLPELGHGFLGAAISALRGGGVIVTTGQLVPSTSAATKGHGIHVWRLTAKGHQIAAARRERRAAA
ncbi:hypothetical protein OG875_05205 [Streptomyces sp. NBC_01498]|uniref:hypothetical protein n=1 Tax=Streptomyces sp. NBC_01498 TaxID=2975870 RepID=UPI002E7B73E1|nr:hypothetical protein [Streptomyces sp. NBC_01498]WTL24056.1 hypothetical protein OG875_05205 [Streptomyces sp. NBC_01498]